MDEVEINLDVLVALMLMLYWVHQHVDSADVITIHQSNSASWRRRVASATPLASPVFSFRTGA